MNNRKTDRLLAASAALALAAASGCLTITTYVGDSALAAASGCGTNAVAAAASELPTTNGTVRVTSESRGGLVINIQANQPKHVSPVTDLTVPLTK